MIERVIDFLKTWCEAYGYPVLFFGVLLENAGLLVPGETAVLVAGLLASEGGGHRFRLGTVILVTTVAAILGDNIGFALGRRWARPRLVHGVRFLFLTPQAFADAETYFLRYGSWTIFFARFVTGLRVVGALAAGAAGMPWPQFLLANASGALLWAVTISLLGYFVGENLDSIVKWLHRSGWIALGLVIALIIFWWWRRKRSSQVQIGSAAELGDPSDGSSQADRPRR